MRSPSVPTVLVLGTDTGVGKTHVACALLSSARTLGLAPLPFKPCESGRDELDPSATDAARLCQAAGLDPEKTHSVAPLTYGPALAPGIAHDPAPFLPHATSPPDPSWIQRATRAWTDFLDAHPHTRLAVVEFAGGLLVPMPGGTWQPDWVRAFSSHHRARPARIVVVARAGLGTIHHTLATLEALRTRALTPHGFLFSTPSEPDPSAATNAAVIAKASAVPYLGTVAPGATELPAPLLRRLASPA